MWWETLPTLAIVSVALTSNYIFIWATNKFMLGNPYKRALNNFDDAHHYLRDIRVGNSDPYNQIGLESLDDDTPTKT